MSQSSIPNSLNIVEPSLLKSHNRIIQSFIQNDIPFEAEYQKAEDGFSANILYTITTNTKRCGLITSNDGKFGGVVAKGEMMRYLQKEGFDVENDETQPVFAFAPCVMAFVCMIAIDRLGKLEFDSDLIEEFDRITKTNKNKKTSKKTETK